MQRPLNNFVEVQVGQKFHALGHVWTKTELEDNLNAVREDGEESMFFFDRAHAVAIPMEAIPEEAPVAPVAEDDELEELERLTDPDA